MTQTLKFGAAATLATALSFAAVVPAFAAYNPCWWCGPTQQQESTLDVTNDNDAKVTVSNKAVVFSSTGATATTGGNYADGSTGGRGGDAGTGADDVEDNFYAGVGSTGGNGGNAGVGGTVRTGKATATAVSENTANTSYVVVEDNCGCAEDTDVAGDYDEVTVENDSDIKVRVRNEGFVWSSTFAGADTGNNVAKGSRGGRGGDAGTNADDVEDNFGAEVDSAGGEGGAGDEGGLIETGDADAADGSVNTVNTTVVRVRR